jgi:predicted porin
MIRIWTLLLTFIITSMSAHGQLLNSAEDVDKESIRKSESVAEGPIYETPEDYEESVPSEVETRELVADEDPSSDAKTERSIKLQEEETGDPGRATGFDLYSSLRIRYRKQNHNGAWEDGSSRVGIEADQRFLKESFLFARYEAGFNVLDGLDTSKSSEEFMDTIFKRLSYVGLDTPNTEIIVGKNWSTYYQIGAFTDRFMGAGGDAVGVFNAQTDGGSTGTGRANSVFQTKFSLDFLPSRRFKPFEMNIQTQHGNAIPLGGGTNYGTAIGISSVINTQNNFSVGIAYNYAEIDLDDDPILRNIGITGSAQSLLIGTRDFGERWYTGMVVARLENHETTDQGIYFNGWGSEFYGQYRLSDPLWLVGGYNILEPDSNQTQAGDYRIRYAVVGLRYSFDDFRRMVFANVRINDGLDADGSPQANIYTIGIKWNFSLKGWRALN